MTGPSTEERLISLAQWLVAMRNPEPAEAIATVMADLAQAEGERDEARDEARRLREVMDGLDKQHDDSSVVFAVRVRSLPAAPYSSQEYAKRLCDLWEDASRREYSTPLISVQWNPTRARLDAAIDRERLWSRAALDVEDPDSIGGAGS